MNGVVKKQVRDFHPDHIFDCGQAFRWEREEDGSYTGIAGDHIANIQFRPQSEGASQGELVISNTTEEEFEGFWKGYLDLDRDYGKIKTCLSEKDSLIKDAIVHGSGIRLLRQEPWETLLSFLISQNNHIPRIKKCINSLCENFGQKAGSFRGRTYYSFPQPEDLAGLEPEDLDVCKLGYRAKYIIGTARQVLGDGVEQLKAMGEPGVSSEQAFDYVTHFCGVGPKVANCILLFSMGKYNSFPVDVWVKKVMKELYSLESPKDIADFAEHTFGEYGGFAQQYLFYYIREKK